MKSILKLIMIFVLVCCVGCQKQEDRESTQANSVQEEKAIIDSNGTTLKTRILVPEGYSRKDKQGLTLFLRDYALKEDGSPVLLYDGSQKGNQKDHVAVFKLPIENVDLQQCADSVMRVYAEYYYQTKQYDKISFHFVNGFEAKYSKWRQGYKISVNGNQCQWIKSSKKHTGYESFQQYLRIVFSYASTLSMEKESKKISLSQIQVGDVFLKAGSPGHVVMIVDVCENKSGKKAFLLAQGYMPAQEFHVLKNPKHEDDPWYYEEEVTYPLITPEYTFQEGSLKHLNY